MLDRVSNVVLGLDGLGETGRFADYSQWEYWQAEQVEAAKRSPSSGPAPKVLPTLTLAQKEAVVSGSPRVFDY